MRFSATPTRAEYFAILTPGIFLVSRFDGRRAMLPACLNLSFFLILVFDGDLPRRNRGQKFRLLGMQRIVFHDALVLGFPSRMFQGWVIEHFGELVLGVAGVIRFPPRLVDVNDCPTDESVRAW